MSIPASRHWRVQDRCAYRSWRSRRSAFPRQSAAVGCWQHVFVDLGQAYALRTLGPTGWRQPATATYTALVARFGSTIQRVARATRCTPRARWEAGSTADAVLRPPRHARSGAGSSSWDLGRPSDARRVRLKDRPRGAARRPRIGGAPIRRSQTGGRSSRSRPSLSQHDLWSLRGVGLPASERLPMISAAPPASTRTATRCASTR